MNQVTSTYRYPMPARVIHAAMAAFYIGSWATGELGEAASTGNVGYMLHATLGFLAGAALLARLIYGFIGPAEMRFGSWLPVTRQRLATVGADLGQLARMRMPEHPHHGGLAGLVQSFGMVLLAWMVVSGGLLHLGIVGSAGHEVLEAVEEGHEVGEALVPLYLLLHVGAVVLHALRGKAVWRRML